MAQRKRILALLLALCLFASFLGTLPRASATEASLGIGTVDIGQPGKTTPIYDKPNGTPTHWLKDGTDVSILVMEKGKNGELWYKVEYTTDVVGYIQSTNISTTVTPSTTSPTGKVGIVNKKVTSSLLVRSKPATKGYKILERLSPGDKVTVIGTEISDGIKYDIVLTEKGNKGWCTSGYINTGATSSSPNSSELPGEIIGEYGNIIARSTIYKYDRETESMIPSSVSFVGGERVEIKKLFTDKNGDKFYLVQFGNLINYVRKDNALRDSEKEFHGRPGSIDSSKKGTVNSLVTSNLMVRSKPSEKDYTVLARLYCGDQVSIIQTTTISRVKWFRVLTEDGIEGWVKAQYINEGTSQQNNTTAPSSSGIPSTKGKSSYLAANSAYNNVRTPDNKIVQGIEAGTLFHCYGKCDYDPNRVWIDLNNDGRIDGSIIRGGVRKVNIDAVIVSIPEQKVYVLRNYKIVFSARCITGNKGTKDTNLGVQAFIELKPGTFMEGTKPNGEEYRTWTDFWMQFNDCEEAIHNSRRRNPSDYTPYTYDGDGSYGCVNVTYDTAEILYNTYAYMGEQVIVTMSTSKIFK